MKTDLEKSTKKEIILQINYLYNLDRITIQKIQVNASSFEHKNICCGFIFGRPDTLTILCFDCNFSGNDSMCCHQHHSLYGLQKIHTIAQNEAPHRYWGRKTCYRAHPLKCNSAQSCAFFYGIGYWSTIFDVISLLQ